MSRLLRVSSEDFPTPTSQLVEWKEAGVVFFVDVCRSQFELKPPSVWMLDQPSPYEEENGPTELCTLQVSPQSSVSFRCSYFIPKIFNNVLLLFLGDAYASSSSSGSSPSTENPKHHHHHSLSSPSQQSLFTPFFGVCASLLPPAELVQQHGIEAFSSFSFSWLCGPEIHSMRPAARIGFACAITEISPSSSSNQQNQQNSEMIHPNVSIWIHGGVPLAPVVVSSSSSSASLRSSTTTTNTFKRNQSSNSSYYEPLLIVPDPDSSSSESDLFVLGGANQQHQQHQDKYLRKAVSEDFYAMFELKLCIIPSTTTTTNNTQKDPSATPNVNLFAEEIIDEGAVSVWPWIRHPGLPLICHHSLSAIPLLSNGENGNNNTKRFLLVVFGGLRLELWKSSRSQDLLPPFKNTEFSISNTFYSYDILEENWEWRDALIGSMRNNGNSSDSEVAANLMKENKKRFELSKMNSNNHNNNEHDQQQEITSLALIGARPPPVFEHHIVEIQKNSRNSSTFYICGGLRGRFTEKSKEVWSFEVNSKTGIIQCNQQTGPPMILQNQGDQQQQQQDGNMANSTTTTTSSLSSHIFCLFNRVWVVDLKKKKMWHRQLDEDDEDHEISSSPKNNNNNNVSGGKYPWEGPVSIVSSSKKMASERGRSIDLDNPPPTLVQITRTSSPPKNQTQQQYQNGNNSTNKKQFSTSAAAARGEFDPDENQEQRDEMEKTEEAAEGNAAGNASPGTNAFVMDAFEF